MTKSNLTDHFFPSVSSEEEEIRKRDYGVSPITPRSAAQLRLRFLSRVGQQVSVKSPGRGGGLPILKARGCSSKILIKPLKETNLGVARALFDP